MAEHIAAEKKGQPEAGPRANGYIPSIAAAPTLDPGALALTRAAITGGVAVPASARPLLHEGILGLQATHGNQFVQRMLAQRELESGIAEDVAEAAEEAKRAAERIRQAQLIAAMFESGVVQPLMAAADLLPGDPKAAFTAMDPPLLALALMPWGPEGGVSEVAGAKLYGFNSAITARRNLLRPYAAAVLNPAEVKDFVLINVEGTAAFGAQMAALDEADSPGAQGLAATWDATVVAPLRTAAGLLPTDPRAAFGEVSRAKDTMLGIQAPVRALLPRVLRGTFVGVYYEVVSTVAHLRPYAHAPYTPEAIKVALDNLLGEAESVRSTLAAGPDPPEPPGAQVTIGPITYEATGPGEGEGG